MHLCNQQKMFFVTTKHQVNNVLSNSASYSNDCNTEANVDDRTNKMYSMRVSMCNSTGDQTSISWKKLTPFRDTLRTLYVEKNDFVSIDMDSINKLKVLEEFVLRDNEDLDTLDALPNAPTLHTLRIIRNGGGGADNRMEITKLDMSSLNALVHLQVCNCSLPSTGRGACPMVGCCSATDSP